VSVASTGEQQPRAPSPAAPPATAVATAAAVAVSAANTGQHCLLPRSGGDPPPPAATQASTNVITQTTIASVGSLRLPPASSGPQASLLGSSPTGGWRVVPAQAQTGSCQVPVGGLQANSIAAAAQSGPAANQLVSPETRWRVVQATTRTASSMCLPSGPACFGANMHLRSSVPTAAAAAMAPSEEMERQNSRNYRRTATAQRGRCTQFSPREHSEPSGMGLSQSMRHQSSPGFWAVAPHSSASAVAAPPGCGCGGSTLNPPSTGPSEQRPLPAIRTESPPDQASAEGVSGGSLSPQDLTASSRTLPPTLPSKGSTPAVSPRKSPGRPLHESLSTTVDQSVDTSVGVSAAEGHQTDGADTPQKAVLVDRINALESEVHRLTLMLVEERSRASRCRAGSTDGGRQHEQGESMRPTSPTPGVETGRAVVEEHRGSCARLVSPTPPVDAGPVEAVARTAASKAPGQATAAAIPVLPPSRGSSLVPGVNTKPAEMLPDAAGVFCGGVPAG